MRRADLSPLDPRLIYGSLTVDGEAGKEASRPGFDSTALCARTGLMDLVRRREAGLDEAEIERRLGAGVVVQAGR